MKIPKNDPQKYPKKPQDKIFPIPSSELYELYILRIELMVPPIIAPTSPQNIMIIIAPIQSYYYFKQINRLTYYLLQKLKKQSNRDLFKKFHQNITHQQLFSVSQYLQIYQIFIGTMSLQKGIFAGGCFWCIEAQFQRVKGVASVVSGYTGGAVINPKYEQVKKGQTGHYEVVQVTFDPTIISYQKLLDIFFVIHDPTQQDGQGEEDIGTQYMSAAFYQNESQRQQIIKKIDDLTHNEGLKIATKVLPLEIFYPAEEYHQNYWNLKGKENPYCNIIPGKIAKLRKYFKDQVVQNE